jgi:hypothetical protein
MPVVLLLALPACEMPSVPGGSDPELTPADRQLLDNVKRAEEAKKDLEVHPARYITMVGDWQSYDKGIINTYTKVTSAEVRNGSDFDVSDIRGEFTYYAGDGSVMATVPITFEGELRAGETKKLQADSQEISGGASKGELTVKSVRVRK